MDFAVPTDHRVKLKESEKGDNNLVLAREQKKTHQKTWKMNVMVIPIVIGADGTILPGLIKELDDIEIKD